MSANLYARNGIPPTREERAADEAAAALAHAPARRDDGILELVVGTIVSVGAGIVGLAILVAIVRALL